MDSMVKLLARGVEVRKWARDDVIRGWRAVVASACTMASEISYRQYVGEADLPHIMALVQTELSEPYVIYTYRYFLHQWCVPASSSAHAHTSSQAPARVPRASPAVPAVPAHPCVLAGHPPRIVRPDRRDRVQAEHAQARRQQRLHRHAQRQQELAQTRRR